jgi:hypothetical protein
MMQKNIDARNSNALLAHKITAHVPHIRRSLSPNFRPHGRNAVAAEGQCVVA